MNFLKKILPAGFKRDIKEKLGVPSLHWSLLNLRRCGFNPRFAIDGGAYIGKWTTDFIEIFPDAKVLMIEPQLLKEPLLKKLCDENKNIEYKISLLGSEEGKEVYFVENETISYASGNQSDPNSKKVIIRTLDSIVEHSKNKNPDFLKLDVQGYELEVLKGATNCLKTIEVCLLEVTIFDWGDRVIPLIAETLPFMDARGFVVYDIAEIMRRPLDKALNQIDLLFVRRDSKLIADKRWN